MTRKTIIVFLLLIMAAGCHPATPALTPTASSLPLSGKLTFAGSTTIQPLAAKVGEAFNQVYPHVQLDIAAGGSSVGIQAVKDGLVDIGMSSRALAPEEASGLEQYQIAIDVIAIVVHPHNPVQGLTLEQLRAIYRGDLTNWKTLGGADETIVPVAREKTSGTRAAFDELVLAKQEPAAANLRMAITAGDAAAIIATEPAAIGYVGFGNIGNNLKVVPVGGVHPSVESAKNNSYPLLRPLLLLTGPLSQPLARSFIDYILSPDGQRLVGEFGWVPIDGAAPR